MNPTKLWTIARKDLTLLLRQKLIRLPLITVPLVIAGLLPAAFTLAGFFFEELLLADPDVAQMLALPISVPEVWQGQGGALLYLFFNHAFSGLFLLLPLMGAIVGAAGSVVGEREKHTLETLLSAPVSRLEVFAAKALAAVVLGLGVAFGGFALFFGLVNGLSLGLRGAWLVSAPSWFAVLFGLAPPLTLLGVCLTLWVSLKAESMQGAQQGAVLLILPVMGLFISQMTGALVLDALWLSVLSIGLWAAAGGLAWFVAGRYRREDWVQGL